MGKPAARIGDMHVCPTVNPGPSPHVGGPVFGPCSANVVTGRMPQARVTDNAACTLACWEVAMPDYRALGGLMPAHHADGLDLGLWRNVTSCLVGIWLEDYRAGQTEVVEVSSQDFSYLFDIEAERLISAWGISRGRHGEERDKNRMRGHPLSAGPLYHRGHAIPHSLGGAMDINLVPQRGFVNVGAFRKLEKEAVATPGALYFTHWQYPHGVTVKGFPTQLPIKVDQGLLVPGRPPAIVSHAN